MGYETTLYFVDNWNKKKAGYLEIVASVDLSKVAYNKFGELLDIVRTRQKVTKQVEKLLNELREIRNKKSDMEEHLFWNGEMPIEADANEKLTKKEFDIERKLEKKLPFIYIDGNTQEFEDSCGEVLMIATLEEVRKAIAFDQAKEILDEEYDNEAYGYRRFDIALKIIESLSNKNHWSNIEVVMWGH